MYNVPYFKAANHLEVLDFMQAHPFVIVTGVDANNQPVATHLPVLIEERDEKVYLLAHLMKQTDHHKAFLHNNNVLAIFSGAHTYVSASWYKEKKQASTWNYQAVHAAGQLTFLNDDSLLNVLQKLTAHFENDQASPSLVEKMAPEYVQRLMKAIVAFEIEVTKIDHVFKLSQNRATDERTSIVAHLLQGDAEAKTVASAMEAVSSPSKTASL